METSYCFYTCTSIAMITMTILTVKILFYLQEEVPHERGQFNLRCGYQRHIVLSRREGGSVEGTVLPGPQVVL